MDIDLELYRREVRVALHPQVNLSVIDIAPDHPRHTMLFVHGFGGQATQWQYQLHNFSSTNRVIAVDLRGHGASDKPRFGYEMDQILSDLGMVLDTLGVTEKIVLAGHSFGGAVVTEFATAHPARVGQLILIAAAGEYRLNPVFRLLLNLPSAYLQALVPLTRKWLGAPPHILQSWYMNILVNWNGWNLFRNLRQPTLVIRGHLDAVFEKVLAEEVPRAIPGAEDIDVGASGHMVMLERREAVNRAISRFIDADKRAWSRSGESSEKRQDQSWIDKRPWLPHYDEGVPYTIAIPRVPLQALLRSAAQRFPRRSALIYEGKAISYQRLEDEANRFANTLLGLGLKKGEHVMLLMPNIPQMVIAFYGVIKAGGVAVFTLPNLPSDELLRHIQDAEATILVTLTQFDELIQGIKSKLEMQDCSPLKHVIFTHIADYLPGLKRLALNLSAEQRQRHLLDIPLDASIHQFHRLLYAHSKDAPEVEIASNDLAVIIYTGGTTADPKGVMLSHANLVANALQTRHWMPGAQEGQERTLSVIPFAHSYGLTAALNMPVALGATILLKPRFETADILKTIQRYRPSIFPGVPQMYIALKDFPGVRKYGIQSIKACISGSAPLPVEVQEAFEKLTRGRLVEGYGLTEATTVTHANPLDGQRKVGSIGIPLPSTEARLVDLRKGEKEVPVGQIGELAIRGPQVMLGYWSDPEATSQVLNRDGWLLTGDIAQVDSEGYFRLIARKADMWYPKQPGAPAFPRDVEEVLYEVPQVKEAAVIVIARQPIAFVIAHKQPPQAEDLIAYCQRRLPPELVPRLVIFVDEFPRSFIGKILRRELSRRFQESHPPQQETE